MALAAVPEPDLVTTYEMPAQVSMLSDAWNRIRRNRLALLGACIIVLLLLTAILATFWTPYPVWLQAVGPTYQGPSAAHPLGLDQAGRDILSRIMGGADP
jgi:peptide/nickel transport system permease protein